MSQKIKVNAQNAVIKEVMAAELRQKNRNIC